MDYFTFWYTLKLAVCYQFTSNLKYFKFKVGKLFTYSGNEKIESKLFKRTASKHVYYLGWNRSPAQVGCMRQVLGSGALGRPRGIGWRGRWEWGLGWGIHVHPWLILVNVWQKPLQYCKVISLQLIKKKKTLYSFYPFVFYSWVIHLYFTRKGWRQGATD